jgi:hypothetical protein
MSVLDDELSHLHERYQAAARLLAQTSTEFSAAVRSHSKAASAARREPFENLAGKIDEHLSAIEQLWKEAGRAALSLERGGDIHPRGSLQACLNRFHEGSGSFVVAGVNAPFEIRLPRVREGDE